MLVQVQVFRRVKAEPVHTQVQVEFRDVQHFLPDRFGIKVQFRHRAGEIVLHPDAARQFFHKAPAGRRLLIRSDAGVKIIARSGRVVHRTGIQETPVPDMLAAGVVQGQVQDDLHIPPVAGFHQLPQVIHRPESRINGVIIHHVILVVGRGFEDRRQPDPLHSQALSGRRIPVVQVIHPVDDSPQVPCPVFVGVGKRTDKDLVKYPVVVHNIPSVIKGQALRRAGSRQQRQCQDQDGRDHRGPLFHADSPCRKRRAAPAARPPC